MRTPAHALLLLLALLLPFIGPPAQAAETVTYYHTDALGSPVTATDASGNLVWRETYRPYGERLNNQPASSDNPIWYTGKRQDAETGLVYMGSRYYDPRLGRFLSIDPVEPDENNLHSLNRYAYANNNPYKFTDPDGQNPFLVLIAFGMEMINLANSDGPPGGGLTKAGANTAGKLATKGEEITQTVKQAADRGAARVGEKAAEGVEKNAASKGRLGNEATRTHVNQVSTEMEKRGWAITHGGGRGPEEYLPGPGGARRGSSYPDITATKNGKTLRVNTVDTRADGITLTTREARNAARIRSQTGEHVLTIPKP